jgi:hypothetical protein
MKLNPVIERILYVGLIVMALTALALFVSSDAATNFVTVNSIYQGF